MNIPFNNSYANLPAEFYSKLNPTPVKSPSLIIFNHKLAKGIGITDVELNNQELAQIFSGNKILEGAEPLAMVYAGHQFGGFSDRLGDGRANLLGEVVVNENVTGEQEACSTRYDIQLKGSGATPYSRGGDGRSALGPVLREYLVSEAMAKLGVPTTRALAAVKTGEEVARTSLVAGGILTRIAKGFVRVGTFQYFSARRNITAIKQLADYEIERHYSQSAQNFQSTHLKSTRDPKVRNAEDTDNTGNIDNPYAAFLSNVVNAQAKLIAQWMHLGFIHGVMNTDNMSIAGETIDYGPCAFMDEFEHDRVYSSIDHHKRYAYSNQPNMGQWNLIRLAETLLPLFIKESSNDFGSELSEVQSKEVVSIAQNILNTYEEQYQTYWLTGMRHKLGLFQEKDEDAELINTLFSCMEKNKADFTLTFYYLSCLSAEKSKLDSNLKNNMQNKIQGLFDNPEELVHWLEKWRDRLSKESLNDKERQTKMQSINPLYIPRNHLIEEAIRAAEDHGDFSVFHKLHEVLQTPFEYQKGQDRYMKPPNSDEIVHQTFCGT